LPCVELRSPSTAVAASRSMSPALVVVGPAVPKSISTDLAFSIVAFSSIGLREAIFVILSGYILSRYLLHAGRQCAYPAIIRWQSHAGWSVDLRSDSLERGDL